MSVDANQSKEGKPEEAETKTYERSKPGENEYRYKWRISGFPSDKFSDEGVDPDKLFGAKQASTPPVDQTLINSTIADFTTSAESVSARRQSIHSIFVGLNTLCVGAIGYLISRLIEGVSSECTAKFVFSCMAGQSLIGLVLTWIWMGFLRDFQIASWSRVKLMEAIEKVRYLKIYTNQYELVSEKRYVAMINHERYLTWFFAVLYVLCIIATIVFSMVNFSFFIKAENSSEKKIQADMVQELKAHSTMLQNLNLQMQKLQEARVQPAISATLTSRSSKSTHSNNRARDATKKKPRGN